MTDTTITPEEREGLRNAIIAAQLRPDLTDGMKAINEMLTRLLNALEAAEASKAEAEDYAEKLVYAVTDGNLSSSYDVQVVADEVSRIWQSYTDQKVAAARAETEAENARLRAALDWLREREVNVFGFAAPCQCDGDYFEGEELAPCGENADAACPRYNHRGCGACWVEHAEREAARRAVAGEGEVRE